MTYRPRSASATANPARGCSSPGDRVKPDDSKSQVIDVGLDRLAAVPSDSSRHRRLSVMVLQEDGGGPTSWGSSRRPPSDDPPVTLMLGCMPEIPEDGAVKRLHSGTSTLKRSGAWKVPSRLYVASLTGAVKLDFREALLPAGPIDIEIESGTGAIDLILPVGATVDVSGLVTGTGRVRSAAPSQPASRRHRRRPAWVPPEAVRTVLKG
jgi:hypothetical protein